MSIELKSPAFVDGEMMPGKYSCDGENVNPPFLIEGIPEGTKSLVLLMDDPDIPQEIKDKVGISKFNHWSVYNLPADTTEITEANTLGANGLNSRDEANYTGPCPPTEYEPTTHRYIFRLYALSDDLNFSETPTLDVIEMAAKEIALDQAELVGLYTRVKE